tara:strand:- start:289 stop:672 length:384 start_codon:yes stop_codon:yes gene_type:complete
MGIITSLVCMNETMIDKYDDKLDDLKLQNNKLEKEIVELKKNIVDNNLTNINNAQSSKILLKQIELLNKKIDNNKVDNDYLVESYEKLLENLNDKNVLNTVTDSELNTDNEIFESLDNDTEQKLKEC